jgi:hypothetical protein
MYLRKEFSQRYLVIFVLYINQFVPSPPSSIDPLTTDETLRDLRTSKKRIVRTDIIRYTGRVRVPLENRSGVNTALVCVEYIHMSNKNMNYNSNLFMDFKILVFNNRNTRLD